MLLGSFLTAHGQSGAARQASDEPEEMREEKNIYYRTPVGEYWLENPPRQVFEATVTTVKALEFISSIQTISRDEEFARTIIATGVLRFLAKERPLGLYVEVSPRNEGSRLLIEIYFRKVHGFFIEVFGEQVLRRKCHSIERSIFNQLNRRTSDKQLTAQQNAAPNSR